MNKIKWIRQHPKIVATVLAILLVVAVITWRLVFHANSPGEEQLNDAKALISKLIVLPTDETPTLAIVEDKAQLKDKTLAAKAQNGDNILIYTKNKLAVIYRPGINKIVAEVNVTIDQAVAEAEGASITVLNGTNDPDITNKVKQEINAAYPNIRVVTANANRHDFPTTIVIDNTNNKDYLQQSLMTMLHAKQGVVPLGEDKASTSMMVLIGADSL